jgi:hypothetical protein
MTVYVCGFGVMQSLLTCSTSSFKVAKFYLVCFLVIFKLHSFFSFDS